MRRLPTTLLAVVAAVAAVVATAAVPSSAVAASGYCTGAGVSVVVDFTGVGGGIERGCAAHGAGGNAWDAFQAAGFPLTGVQRYPGAVCRVSGRPADAPCQSMPPADAYWGFFTSHGSGWNYASVGPSSYRVADGDTVGFAWQTGAHRAPGAAPAAHHATSTPRPTPTPAPKHSSQPAGHASAATPASRPSAAATPSGPAEASATPAAGASPRTAPGASAAPIRSARARTTASAGSVTGPAPASPGAGAASAGASPAAAGGSTMVASTTRTTTGDGVPWWLPVLVLLGLVGAAGALVWRRRAALR